MADPLDIVGAGKTLLAALETNLINAGFPADADFALYPGVDIPFDVEVYKPLVAVNLLDITPGWGNAAQSVVIHPSEIRQVITFGVWIIVPVSTVDEFGFPPGSEELRADFALTATCISQLWNALTTMHSSYELAGTGIPFTYGPVTPVGPEGGLVGSHSPVRWDIM